MELTIRNLIKHFFTSFLILCTISSCSKPQQIQVKTTAISENGYGILLTKVITHKKSEVPMYQKQDTVKIPPMIPNEYGNFVELKHLFFKKLPNYITFEYQYTELSECSSIYNENTVTVRFLKDYSPIQKGDTVTMNIKKAEFLKRSTERINKKEKKYFTKNNCKKWIPIDSLKFTKTIDLTAYKKSKKMQLFRKRNPNASGSYYGANVIFEFYDDGDIKVNIKNTVTNPWQ